MFDTYGCVLFCFLTKLLWSWKSALPTDKTPHLRQRNVFSDTQSNLPTDPDDGRNENDNDSLVTLVFAHLFFTRLATPHMATVNGVVSVVCTPHGIPRLCTQHFDQIVTYIILMVWYSFCERLVDLVVEKRSVERSSKALSADRCTSQRM